MEIDPQVAAALIGVAGGLITSTIVTARKVGNIEQTQKDFSETFGGCIDKIDKLDDKVDSLDRSAAALAEFATNAKSELEKSYNNRTDLRASYASMDKRVTLLEKVAERIK